MTKMRFIFLFSIFISQSQHFFLSFFQQLAYRVDRINTSLYLSWKRINEQLANEYETKLAKEKQNTKKDKFYQKSAKKAQLSLMNTWLFALYTLHTSTFISNVLRLPSHIPYGFHRLFRLRRTMTTGRRKIAGHYCLYYTYLISQCVTCVGSWSNNNRERERISEDVVWQVAASGWVELRLKSTLNWQ